MSALVRALDVDQAGRALGVLYARCAASSLSMLELRLGAASVARCCCLPGDSGSCSSVSVRSGCRQRCRQPSGSGRAASWWTMSTARMAIMAVEDRDTARASEGWARSTHAGRDSQPVVSTVTPCLLRPLLHCGTTRQWSPCSSAPSSARSGFQLPRRIDSPPMAHAVASLLL
jgi:hypothetical protein